MGLSRRADVTVGEYLAMENASPERHEYFEGVVYAMSGGSPRHNLLVGNLHRMLGTGLRGRPCVMLPEGQRIFIPATGLYTYSDALVVCDGPRFHSEDPRSLTNPRVICEVLSPSTEGYDRGEKFQSYQSIESLQEYVLVEQHRRRVEHFLRRANDQWLLTSYEGEAAVVSLPTVDVSLSVAELYEQMESFPADAATRGVGR